MEIEKYLESQNWFVYPEFYDFISSKKFETLVEVGVWKGHSISYLADKNRESKIWAVDLFENTDDQYYHGPGMGEQIPYIYEIYQENLKKKNVRDIITDIKGYSHESASLFEDESVDFVFIDACHDYECVKNDIDAWYVKIKSGGIISGHDYGSYSGVTRAVNEFVVKYNLQLLQYPGFVWYCNKP